jgi:hypothetical protein
MDTGCTARRSSQSGVAFAPGDLVIRYVGGQPFFCTVVEVQIDENVRVSCNLWPSGYNALVKAQEVTLVSRGAMSMDV